MLRWKNMNEIVSFTSAVLHISNEEKFAILREALYIVESGAATVEDLDNVMKYGLGLRYAALGPFLTADFGGLDTFKHISDYLFQYGTGSGNWQKTTFHLPGHTGSF